MPNSDSSPSFELTSKVCKAGENSNQNKTLWKKQNSLISQHMNSQNIARLS
jgi:hypothetical protein